MSQDVWVSDDGKVTVSSFVGPTRSDPGAPISRVRWQFAVVSDQDGKHHTASIDANELPTLVARLAEELESISP